MRPGGMEVLRSPLMDGEPAGAAGDPFAAGWGRGDRPGGQVLRHPLKLWAALNRVKRLALIRQRKPLGPTPRWPTMAR